MQSLTERWTAHLRRSADLLIITIFAVLTAVATPAQAEDFSSELAELDLDELFEVDLVYGASKFEQKTSEAPASISIIRAAEIKNMGYQTLADVLNSVRGFYSTYDRNYHYAGVRGFGRPGDYNTRLLVLINGHRVNDNVYDAAPVGNDFPLDLEVVDRIEVIRGPGSSLYGTSAMFGVINVVTKSAEQIEEASVSGTVGSFGTREGTAHAGQLLGPEAEIVLSGSYYRSHGQDYFFEEFNKSESNNGMAQEVDREEYERLFGQFAWHGLRVQVLHSSREKRIPTAPWGTVFNDPRTQTVDSYTYMDLAHEQRLTTTWSLKSSLGYHRYSADENYVYEYAEGDTPYFSVWTEDATGTAWTGEVQLSGVFSDQNRVTVGAELGLNPQEDQSSFDEEAVYLDSQRDSQDWAAFAEYELKPTSTLILNLGVRHDHHDAFGGTTNPRTALIYSPRDGRTLKLLYGRAFRAPNNYELFYHDGELTTKAANSLEPETIQTWEAVWEEYLGKNLFLSTSIFRYELNDLISQTTDPEDDLLVFVNVDAAEANGAEVELKRQWARGLTGHIGYGFQETTDGRTGELLSNAPKHLGRLGFTLPVLDPTTIMGLEVLYEGSRRTITGGKTVDAVLTNMTATKSRLFGIMDISGSVYNLFDVKHEHPGFEEHSQTVILQDGRQFKLTTSVNF